MITKSNFYDYIIVGAGISGLVIAERIANELNKKVLIIEKKNHIGGACFDFFDDHGFLVGKYGPHTFHTNDEEVFEYFKKFCEWHEYIHKALSYVDGKFVHFPICKKTLVDLYGGSYTNSEALEVIKQNESNLIDKFFRSFTFKQWGCQREELDPSVIARIPFRNNDDDRYFTDKYQGNPVGGYTSLFERMIASPNIEVCLGHDYKKIISDLNYRTMIYTGPIDYYFDYKLGNLLYRSVRFKFEFYNIDSFQPVASTRYPGLETEYTRITEFKKMTGQKLSGTTILKETPCFGGEPLYPYPTQKWKKLASEYLELAKKEEKTIFLGRLAEYKYYDMDDAVRRALDVFRMIKRGEK